MIQVRVTPAGSGFTCQVDVAEPGSRTHHTVRVSAEDVSRWGRAGGVEELVRRSFEFLLAREPQESILRSFPLSVIPRYFPDFGEVITRG